MPQVDPSGRRWWVVAGHHDVRSALRDPALGHEVHRHHPAGGSPRPAGEAARVASRQLIELDAPDHTRLRALVAPAFTARAVARLEDRVRVLARRLVERAAELDEVDVVRELADPVPVGVIAEMVGVPEADRGQFRAWSAAVVSGDPGGTGAVEQFAAYVDDLAARRRRDPADDLLSHLVAQLDAGRLDRDELVAMVQLLLVAGQETTVHTVATALRLLLEHPDQWRSLVADPGLAAAAVEETLRYQGPVEITPPRWTFAEVVLAGGPVPAFELVALSLWGANRDPAVFGRPDLFDVSRPDVGRHVAFGHGVHACLGASLGRLEARVVLQEVARLLPGLELVGQPGGAPGAAGPLRVRTGPPRADHRRS
ncbi:cytochrome P450 [Aquipuribacter hungaricus]|uniref:Cytochrome P450 n=1 Tax=Aquipuribacter hungaricus TaxID=545624 RepID=A0ABV7WHJ4_9MICO